MSEDWLERARQRRKEEQKVTDTTNSQEDWLERARQRRLDDEVQKVDSSYINTFFDDAKSFFDENMSLYDQIKWGNASSTYQNRYDIWKDLDHRKSVVQSWLEANRASLGETAYNDYSSVLKNFDTNAHGMLNVFSDAKDYYARWDTEENYEKDLQVFEEYEKKKNLDLEAAKKHIAYLERVREQYSILTRTMTDDWGTARLEELRKEYGELKDLDKLISNEKAYLNQASYIQEGIKLSNVAGNADFERYSGYVSTKADGFWDELRSQYGMGYNDLAYEYINNQNDIRDEIKRNALIYSRDVPFEEKGYDLLTEDEIRIYNYYYAKEGRKAAEKYLNHIQESINLRKAMVMYQEMKGKTAMEIVFGAKAGLDQWESGVKNLFNTEDSYIPQTAVQMASGMVRENLADNGFKLPSWMGGASLGQVAYDVTNTTANMAPSMLTAMAANMVAPGSGAIVGNSMMFASSAGNAYQEALNLGYDKGQARAYSTLVGASEAGLQYMLGGISSMGGKLSGNTVGKILNGIDNAYARIALELGGNILSEGMEESLQEILTPMFKEWSLMADEGINWEEVAYSGLLGALTSFGMEGSKTAINATAKRMQYARDGSAIMNAEGGVDALRQLANEMAGVSSEDMQNAITKQTGKIDKKATNRRVGKLFDTVNTASNQANTADIAKSLTRKGFNEKTANDIAKAIVASNSGQSLTKEQQKLLESVKDNKSVQDAVSNIVANPMSTMGQRSQNIRTFENEIRAGVISKKTGVSMDVARKIVEGKAVPQEESLIENSYKVSADGKTIDKDGNLVSIQGVASIEKGRMVLQTEGGTVDAKDVIYGSQREALVYEAVANLGDIIDTETANKLADHLMKLGETTSEGYVQGIVEAYRYGYYGYSRDKMTGEKAMSATLTEKQRNVAYGRGEWYRDAQTKAEQAKKTAEKKGSSKKDDGVFFQNDKGEVVSYDESGVKTDAKRESGVQTAKVLKKLGLGGRFVFFESHRNEQGEWVYTDTDGNVVKAPNGMYYKDGTIYVDLNAGKGGAGLTLFTLSHELTHFIQQWSPAKYKALADFLIREYEKTGLDVDALVHAKQQDLSENRGEKVSYDEAFHEMVADSMEKMFADGNLVQKLMKLKAQDSGLVNKIKGFVDKLARKIRWYYGSLNPDSFEGRMVGQMSDAIGEIQDKFAEALVEASENYQTAEKNTTHEGEVKMQIREIIGESGKSYGVGVYLDSDVLTNVPDEQREAVVRRQLKKFGGRSFVAYDREGNPQEITVASSDQRFKNAKGRSVPVNEHITSFLRNPIKQEALVLVDEVIATSSFDSKEAAKHPHDWLDDNGKNQWDVWTVFIQEKNKAVWEATLKVANTTNGEKILYELYPIKEVEAARKPGTSSTKATVTHQKPVVNPEPKEKWSQHSLPEIKEKFSLREPVEQTKNLVALHNLTVDKLAKALDLGGFPMPSIAITKADIPHTNFGDITLVFGRETIDPKTNRKNTVYSADAWTPTFPRTEYEENREVGNEIYKLLQKVERKLDDFFHSDLRRVYMDIEGTLNRYDGEEGLIQYAMDNYGLKAAYLEEQGMHIHKSVTQKEADLEFNPTSAERYNRIADILGVESAEEIGAVNLKEARDEHGEELEAVLPGITKSPFRMSRIFSAVKAYLQSQNTGPVYETVTDARATQKSVDDALDQAAYEAWVRKLFAGIVKDSGIYNQKPIFTPSGSRRSFKQTHLPVTLENIVKAMAAQNGCSTKNVSGFNGIKTLRAATAERLKSVDDMHKREGRLQNLTPEQMEAVNDALQSRLYNIIKSIDYENGCEGSDNSLFRYDTIGETITEISESGKFNVSDIQQTFGKYGKEVSDDTALELKQLLFDVAQMPVNIFEAKPERVVRFDEVKAAILPKGTNQSIVDGLLQNGVRIQFYEMNNDAERLQIVNSMEDVKFSDRATESVSNRSLLANAFEGLVQNDIERKRLQEYREKIDLINAEEQKLRKLNEQIKELSFAKGPRDTKAIRDLQDEAKKTANRINIYDTQLLRLEASKPLQDVLDRERKKAYKRMHQKGEEARRKAVAKVKETAEKREARGKLQKLVLDTAKWISYPAKTDVKCPDILKPAYKEFLEGIDMSSKRLADGGDPTKSDLRLANAMSSLATAIDKVMSSQNPAQDTDKVLDIGYLDLPANFVKTLQDMTENIKTMIAEGDYVVNTMSAKEVRKLSQMIRTLNNAIKTTSKLYANLRFANVDALGLDTMEFMDALGEIEKTGGMKDFVQWDNALPYYAFKRFGKGGESVFEGFMDAQDKLAFLARIIFDFRDKTWTGKEAKAWSEDVHTIDLPNGNKLTLTTADAMSIYCLSRREQGLQHLLGGGTRVIGIQKGSGKAKDSRSVLTINDIDAINSSLTNRQKQVAEAIQEFMSTVCSEWGNEISMKRFLTKEFTEKFYFPIESNDENLPTKDPTAQQSDLFRLLNISATKPITPGANNEVIIRNIFDVFSGHASDMARLNAYGMALLDYMKWLNYREKTVNEEGQVNVRGVRKSMELAYGNAAKGYVLNLVKDVNGRASDSGDPTILMKWMRNAKTASVGSSLRVATLQITSYPRAALVLSPKNLVLGLTKRPNITKAQKYCGIALWKSFGFYDTNISRSIEDQMKGVTDVRQKLIELSLKGAEWGDAITWGALWNACEYEVAATKKHTVGSEEFYQAVGKKLREVVYKTQVVDSTLTRSQMMRSKRGMAQEAAAFMSEPTLSANILMDAGFEFSMEKRRSGNVKDAWKKTRTYIGRAVAVYSIGQLTAALLEGLWDAWRDDDDEEFGEKYLNAFVENLVLDLIPFNKIPIVSDAFEAVLAMFNVGFYSSDKMSTTWLTQAVSAVDAWKDVLSGKSSTTAYNALYKSVRAVSSFYGVSFSGVMREGVALWNNTAGAYDTTLKIRQYDLSKADLGGELYDAIISGNTRQADSLKAQFEDTEAMHSAVRKALRENDPRIKEAATADINGDPSERVRVARLIIADGFDQDDVVMAINAEINAMESDEPKQDPEKKGFYTAEDFAREIANGDQTSANAAKVDIIQTAQKNGKTEEEALKGFNSSAKSELKEMFLNGNLSEDQAVSALVSFCGDEREDAEESVAEWAFESEHGFVYGDCKEMFLEGDISASELKSVIMDVEGKTSDEAGTKIVSYCREAYEDDYFSRSEAASIMVTYGGMTRAEAEDKLRYIDVKKQFPDTYVDDAWVTEYYKEVQSSGITIEVFVDYRNKVKGITGKDKKEMRMEVIDSLPISSAQKDALYLAEGWAKSTLKKAPWH